MISVISIGINKYTDVEGIPCAFEDAKRIFDTIKKCVGYQFNDYNSICLENIKQSVFDNFLRNYIKSLSKDDLFILYYSGHGDSDGNGKFYLSFSDSSEDELRISSDYLKDILSYTKARSIVVLDSCFSGVGLNMAEGSDPVKMSKISVLASSKKHEFATHKDSGSPFTEALCKAMELISKTQKEISLVKIVDEIKNEGENCFVNMEEGESDVIIFSDSTRSLYDSDFIEKTLLKVSSSNNSLKEMLWYSMNDLPDYAKTSIESKYLSLKNNKNEGSWLVRKAIGNFLCSCKNSYEKYMPLLESINWMEQCIALNTLKYELNKEVCATLKKIVSNVKTSMNLIWLANLYLTDSDYHDIEISLKSNLSKTQWGVYDIYSRFKKINSNEGLIERIKEYVNNDDLLLYINLENGHAHHLYNKFQSTNLFSFINKSRTNRGRLGYEHVNKKWLMSILYGSWRDYVRFDFKEYLKNNSSNTIEEELTLAEHFWEVETKMSILSYFEYDKVNFERYKETLRWGLTDVHPWVNNIALKLFAGDASSFDIIMDKDIDDKLYPGLLDLFLTAKELGYTIGKYVNRYKFTENEQSALI